MQRPDAVSQVAGAQHSRVVTQLSPAVRHAHAPSVQSMVPQQSALSRHDRRAFPQHTSAPPPESEHVARPQQSAEAMQVAPSRPQPAVAAHSPRMHEEPAQHSESLTHSCPSGRHTQLRVSSSQSM
jgi:hypothetical protein